MYIPPAIYLMAILVCKAKLVEIPLSKAQKPIYLLLHIQHQTAKEEQTQKSNPEIHTETSLPFSTW